MKSQPSLALELLKGPAIQSKQFEECRERLKRLTLPEMPPLLQVGEKLRKFLNPVDVPWLKARQDTDQFSAGLIDDLPTITFPKIAMSEMELETTSQQRSIPAIADISQDTSGSIETIIDAIVLIESSDKEVAKKFRRQLSPSIKRSCAEHALKLHKGCKNDAAAMLGLNPRSISDWIAYQPVCVRRETKPQSSAESLNDVFHKFSRLKD